MARRFPLRYSRWLLPLFWVLGMGPRRSGVEVGDDRVEVRMGWSFRAHVPRSSIQRGKRERNAWFAIGVHTDFRGRWLVNGSAKGIVSRELDPPVPGRFFGIPLKVRRLGLSLEEPDAFLTAVGASSGIDS